MPRTKHTGLLPPHLLVTIGMFFLLGCRPISFSDSQKEETAPPLETPQVTTSPTEGTSIQMTPTLSTPDESSLKNLIEMIKADLANRQAVSVDEIILVEATEVEWSDSSLDCPQPGMNYLQVITPGYRIVLQVNNQTYEYHTNRNAYFVYCENPIPPIMPKP